VPRLRPTAAAPALLLGCAAAAQDLTVQNLAPFPRAEIAAVVVPFARGTVPDLPDLHVADRVTAWQPFGARWPDGSLRQALCLFRVEVPALSEVTLPLQPGPGPAAPPGEWRLSPSQLEFVVRTAQGVTRTQPPVVATLEKNALRQVELHRARLGDTGLVGELIVSGGRGDAHSYVDVAVFFSDPRTPAMQCAIQELALESTGRALLLRHAERLGVAQETTATGSRIVLLRDGVLGDGQGLRRSGALVPSLRGDDGPGDRAAKAATVCPLLGATKWSGTGAFGAFGEPAPLPPWLDGALLRPALAQRHRAFVDAARAGGDPFASFPFGPAKNAGQTGDQADFGAVKLSLVAASGLPSFLLEVEPSVLQEGCRPVHFFEADGSPVLAARHPDWIVWSGRTHWHEGVSRDRLGKPHPEPPFERHGWSGKDREHWSTNYLGAFAQLTGAHWARLELANEVQLYLSGQTVRPDLTTSGAGAPRGAGRTELAACWLWLLTGDTALLARIDERIDKVYLPQWAGRELPATSVRPMAVHHPDARMLQGKTRYWTPWQDALAAVGFAAAFRVTGNENARLLAEELACNAVRHGFLFTDRECVIATALRWQDGTPLSAAELRDPTAALWSYGTAYSEWSLGAVEIARAAAEARGDKPLRELAAQIQARVRGGRKPAKDGFYDRLPEWDAVRWEAKRSR
jgi:hypothetical protein